MENPLRVLVGKLVEVELTEEEQNNPLFRLGVECGKRGMPHESIDLPFLIGYEFGKEIAAGRMVPLRPPYPFGPRHHGFARILGGRGWAESESELRKAFADTVNVNVDSDFADVEEWDNMPDDGHDFHIIRLETWDSEIIYAHIGPFQSLKAAEEWLSANGFSQERPNLWTRSGAATLSYPGQAENIEVGSLRALVEYLKTPKELNFTP